MTMREEGILSDADRVKILRDRRDYWQARAEAAEDKLARLAQDDPALVEAIAFAIDPDAQDLSPAARPLMFRSERRDRAMTKARAALSVQKKHWGMT